ncbi:MAG: hypothetical protein NTW07_00745, partial [candidate division Zixibacteria bacterium]|nr:hypothetical protein [candidate division Zixibacteria bacterium]
MRSLQADEVKPRATLITIVDGTAEPLLGNEELTRLALKENLDRLLERRGFRITDSTPDYNVKLTYRVTRHDRLVSENRTFSYGAQSMSFYSGAGSKATSALGVAIARAVGSSALKMATATSQTTTEQASYVHALSVEFFGPTNSLVWKWESTWDSQRLDAIGSLAAPLQLVLSDLPSDPAHIPWVAAVKSTHALNYFTTK